MHKHHRKMRSQGGGGHPSNILKVSPELHNLIHAHPELAYKHGLLVHSYDDPIEIPVNIPAFLAELGHEHEHKASCEFCGEELHVKPKRPRLKGADRAKASTASIRFPDGMTGIEWDELLEAAEQVELEQPDTKFDPELGSIATGKLIVAVLERFTGRTE